MERAVIVDGTFPDVPLKACTNLGAPKIQKADDDSQKPKKRKASNDDDSGPETVRRSRPDDDDGSGGPNGIGGMGIILGGGVGGLEAAITTGVAAASPERNDLTHNRRRRPARDSGGSSYEFSLRHRVQLAVHELELGFQFSVGVWKRAAGFKVISSASRRTFSAFRAAQSMS